jgi:hypothetical protein
MPQDASLDGLDDAGDRSGKYSMYSSVTKAVSDGPIVKTSQIALPKTICDKVYATNGYSASSRNLVQVTAHRQRLSRRQGSSAR